MLLAVLNKKRITCGSYISTELSVYSIMFYLVFC